MASTVIGLQTIGLEVAIDAIVDVNVDAGFAQKTAMRAAARKARSVSAKGIAGRHGIPMKLVRKRVSFYIHRSEKNRALARIWAGFAKTIKSGEHKKVAAIALAQNPDAFPAKMPSGHRGVFARKQKTRPFGPGARQNPKARGALPIEEAGLSIEPGARPIMETAAKAAMRKTYPATLKRDFLRRVRKRRARRGSR